MVENRLKISDFAKLTGSSLKTVLYYHKIGLLPEPERTEAGYRLYGPAELTRMRLINHLKNLGLDLKRIKDMLGDIHNHKTMREVLESLQTELVSEKKTLEERVAKIEKLLNEKTVKLDEDTVESPSFQMITEILGPDQIEKYDQTCPELFEQHRKLYSIRDNFQWEDDRRESFRAYAEYFKEHPEQFQISLDLGARLTALSQLPEDDPEIEALARDYAVFIKGIPMLNEKFSNNSGEIKPLESFYGEMVADVFSPAQMKMLQLVPKYFLYKDESKKR